jgi:hypothetical protein
VFSAVRLQRLQPDEHQPALHNYASLLFCLEHPHLPPRERSLDSGPLTARLGRATGWHATSYCPIDGSSSGPEMAGMVLKHAREGWSDLPTRWPGVAPCRLPRRCDARERFQGSAAIPLRTYQGLLAVTRQATDSAQR